MTAARSRYEVIVARTPRHGMSLWPMDLALLAISGLILVIVLKYFRFDDSRFLYNAWTYLLGVPSVMIIASMILHLTTGRFIERTLQLSFLLSVTIHLLLLVGTLNMMIFSKYWPDVYDEIAAETTPQKKVMAEFHKTVVAASKSKPDYLRPVPTNNESDERPTPRARREQASDLRQVEMPTDSKPSEAAEPFILPNKLPQPSQPLPTSSAADLQRQRIQAEYPKSTPRIDLPDLDPSQSAPSEPTARDTEVKKTRSNAAPDASKAMKEMESKPLNLASDLPATPRARFEQNPDIQNAVSSLPRISNRSNTLSDRSREAQIPVPEEGKLGSSNAEEWMRMEARSDSIARRTDPTLSASVRSPLEAAGESATNVSPSAASNMTRSERGRNPIEALPGDIRDTVAKKTAGGAASLPSPAMQLLEGPKAFDSQRAVEQSPIPSELAANARSSQIQKRAASNQVSSLTSSAREPVTGTETGAAADARGTLPEGLAPAKGSMEGTALAAENGSSLGATGPIARSKLGEAGGVEGTAQAKIAFADPGFSETKGSGQEGSLDARSMSAARSGNQRGGADGIDNSLQVPGIGESSDATIGSSLTSAGSGIAARRGNSDWMRELDSRREGEMAGPRQKGRRDGLSQEGLEVGSLAGPLGSQPVPVPIEAGIGKGDMERLFGPEPSNASEKGAGRGRADGGPSFESALAFGQGDPDAAPSLALEKGLGGLERRPRDVELADVRITDLQTQRFRRNDLGGPTLGGEGVPIPAPAFQRRLDRNRDPSETESLGALGPEVEQTIERGLAFLAAHQRADGSWHLEDFDTKVSIRSDTAATALAILAFQGAGYTHQQDKYASQVARGLQFLIRHQQPNGDLYLRMDRTSDTNAWLYSHSIASLALCESYGMTQDPLLQKPAQLAVDFMIQSQDAAGGGWRYSPGTGSDTSVTGWFMMALKSAQLAGLEVNPQVFQGIKRWLDNSQASAREKHLYRYNWQAPNTETQRHGREVTPIMTSIGLLMRLYLGWKRDDLPMQQGAKYLLEYPPSEGTREAPLRDTYYWYYATQVMFHMGGDTWKSWNNRLRPMLVESQLSSGKYAGSWEPMGEVPDAWGEFGGRLYVTALNLLSLEVYYRHLPLYEATAK